jgi:hypothetical protein
MNNALFPNQYLKPMMNFGNIAGFLTPIAILTTGATLNFIALKEAPTGDDVMVPHLRRT